MTANATPKTELSQHELNIIATHIEKVSRAAESFKASRLKEKTILVLLHSMTGLAQRDIKLVLDSLPLLEKEFLKPQPPKGKAP